MSIEIELWLKDLVPQTMTRTRGQEAAQTLQSRAVEAGASRVYLVMATNSIVTASFVDELVQQAARMECEGGPEVVFVLTDPDMLDKLRKSTTWRSLTCRYRLRNDIVVKLLKPDKMAVGSSKPETGSKPQASTTGF